MLWYLAELLYLRNYQLTPILGIIRLNQTQRNYLKGVRTEEYVMVIQKLGVIQKLRNDAGGEGF